MVYSQQRNIFVKRDVKLTEPPDAEPHVRWCERSAAKAASYSITFPQRNRLIASWSDRLIVIAAGRGSGAMITASFADKYGKKVSFY